MKNPTLSSARRLVRHGCLVLAAGLLVGLFIGPRMGSVQAAERSGSVGIEGTISAPPPTRGATISLPTNGQSFTTSPITVRGLCPDNLLVKVFKNNVFGGAVQCVNGNYSLTMDLFSGQNELVARVYDDLDQPGPDSNVVVVQFVDNVASPGTRVSLTSNYAKRGANPGQSLEWPIILSGGEGPYAVSVDWGDGSAADLISQSFPGTFTIKHVYESPGVYNIVIKVTDKNGGAAFLQLVGIANGPLSQTNTGQDGSGAEGTPFRTKVLWQPAVVMIPFIFAAFWLGKRYEVYTLRKRLERTQHL
jgi:hypothetical protein